MGFAHQIHSGNILFSLAMVVILTSLAYIFSTFKTIPNVQYQLLFTFLFGLIFVTFLAQRVKKLERITHAVVYLLTGLLLMLVAVSGWFTSPFVATLYIIIIVQSFFFPALVAIVQVAALLVLVAVFPTIGSQYDFLFILSLLGIIPVTFYFREQYLSFKEAENSIVILKKGKRQYSDSVEELEDNHIHRFSAKLRETLTNIKLQAYKIDATIDLSKKKQLEHEIVVETTRALKLLKDFEEDTTGARVISNPKNL